LKRIIKYIKRKEVNIGMDILTPFEISKLDVMKILIYLRKSRAEGKETVEDVLARHERILQDYAIQTFG
jgi:hypothetical protein